MKKLTTEEFIKRAKKIHGDKYDYSLVDYKNNNTKVKIICPIHGVFEQRPLDHLNAHGCKKCGNGSYGNKEFIEKAKKIHGDKYDYSKVEYKNDATKVEIICPKHGSFFVKPGNHLRGNGCAKCLGFYKTNKEFIEKAKKIHGDKYDYSKVEYTGWDKKVEIICPEHGSFWQLPNNHLKGSGCPKCSGKFLTKEENIERAKKIHNDFFDYSKINYKKLSDKVEIICPKHGSFWQRFNAHLRGAGCPICKKSKGERKIFSSLKENGYTPWKDFIPQYVFKNCKNKKEMPFDFYLPKIKLLIEYQGEEHYKPIGRFGGEVGFQKVKINDKLKKDFCMSNDLKLLEIPYWKFKDIDNVLREEIYEYTFTDSENSL